MFFDIFLKGPIDIDGTWHTKGFSALAWQIDRKLCVVFLFYL